MESKSENVDTTKDWKFYEDLLEFAQDLHKNQYNEKLNNQLNKEYVKECAKIQFEGAKISSKTESTKKEIKEAERERKENLHQFDDHDGLINENSSVVIRALKKKSGNSSGPDT